MARDFEYDLLAYPGLVFSKTNVERLATRAALLSVKAAPPSKSRVLELGCGDGMNLLAQAYSFPESEFLGIDLSSAHIDLANEASSNVGIKNVSFVQANVMDLTDSDLGKFDYIIAHGLYSWVPEPVQIKVLDLYRGCLAENGVGFISFNAYPGCRFREVVWDGIRYFTRNDDAIDEKLKKSLMFARLIERSMKEDDPFQEIYAKEVERLSGKEAPYILHDDLSPSLQPFYFHEFADRLALNDLQFLCEADPATSFAGNLNETGQKLVASMGTDIVAREQVLDFIHCRRFRNTLVCRVSAEIDRSGAAANLKDLFISAEMIPEENADLLGPSNVKFSNRDGYSVTTDEPLLKSALAKIGESWPRSVTFKDLESKLRQVPQLQENFEHNLTRVKDSFIQINSVNLLTFSVWTPTVGDKVPEKPECSRFAQFQVGRDLAGICSLDGSVHELDDAGMRRLISLADGSRDRDELISAIRDDETLPTDDGSGNDDLPRRIDKALNYLWLEGFLLPEKDQTPQTTA